jgi:putative PEP-CTERM system histidine kinase
MGLMTVTHLACGFAFLTLALLVAIGRPSNGIGWLALLASCVTALWALIAGLASTDFVEAVPLAETIRSLAWLAFGANLLIRAAGGLRIASKRWLFTGLAIASLVLGIDYVHFAVDVEGIPVTANEVLGHLALAIIGIVLFENLYRNSSEESRWSIAPICIGLGGVFAFDLAVYSDFFLLRREDTLFLSARAVADAIAVPFIALALARNRNWRIDVHVSRKVVFHTATFIASGAFILAVAVVGTVLRAYGGEWGLVAQFSILFGAILVLALALTSGSIRSRLKGFIAENFFSHRYDYRGEWVKFIDTLSSADSANLYERVLKAIADIVDSPAGALWLLEGGDYRPAATWNIPFGKTTSIRHDSELIASFESGAMIRRLDDISDSALPQAFANALPVWIAVPLTHQAGLLGFIILTKPRAPVALDWEVRQLLSTVARQAAVHIAEAQNAIALADAKLLNEYSKRFAFVVHDIKNLVSQLGLVLSNAEKCWWEPAFQEDALHTIRSSVERMNKLLQQLKSAGSGRTDEGTANVEHVAREVAATLNRSGARILTIFSPQLPQVSINPIGLHSALTHLVNNGLEASNDKGVVTIKVDASEDLVTIDVTDQGPGMESSFIQRELFRPFRSTKAAGYGVGVFQVRELARAVGGDLVVDSMPGRGTTMRLVLPAAKHVQANLVSVG